MEGMKEYADNHFELAIIDPPYGIGAGNMTMGSGVHRFKRDDWDTNIPHKVYFDELFRISNNQIIWGGNYFSEYLHPSPNWIVWDKLNPHLSFAEGELAWMRKGDNLRIFRHYSARVEIGGKIHPTQKPVKLYKWLLNRYAKPGDRILDTHVGSGSSRIACHEMGFDFTGYEIDKDYWQAQEDRFYHATRQKELI